MSWRQQKKQFLCFRNWDYLTNFWRNNWWSIIDVEERLFKVTSLTVNSVIFIFVNFLSFSKRSTTVFIVSAWLKSESSESFNFIEKSDLVQLWPQNPPRLWRPLVSEHQVDFDQQLPKFEIDLNCITNLNLEMYMCWYIFWVRDWEFVKSYDYLCALLYTGNSFSY